MTAHTGAELDDGLVRELVTRAAQLTGYAEGAIFAEAIRRTVAACLRPGEDPGRILARLERGDAAITEALRRAVAIGETYFFRHPEHFSFLVGEMLPGLASQAQVRALSAGCASGEEAYSLAACLAGAMPAGAAPSVVGIDVASSALEAARRGVYGTWSVRASGPQLFPVHAAAGEGEVAVLARLRGLVRFEQHDLRAPMLPVLGEFDVVFCRNVLVYLAPVVAAQVIENLLAALAPRGVIVFGTMDLEGDPPGLVPVGPAGVRAFVRPARAAELARRTPTPAPRAFATPRPKPRLATPPAVAQPPATPAPPPDGASDGATLAALAEAAAVKVHARALEHIERDERHAARELLVALTQREPRYVPGLVERALLHGRLGEPAAALGLMRAALDLLARRADDEVLCAPEPSPVAFYRATARAFLDGRRP